MDTSDPQIDPQNEIDLSAVLKQYDESLKPKDGPKKPADKNVDPDAPKAVQIVMKLSGGMIKTAKQANTVLLVFVTVAAITSIYLFYTASGAKRPISPVDRAQLEQMTQMMEYNRTHPQ